jgi:hypothetical protein
MKNCTVYNVTHGFYKTSTCTRQSLHPWLQVRVSTGMGAGSPGKPQGCKSPFSLIIILPVKSSEQYHNSLTIFYGNCK